MLGKIQYEFSARVWQHGAGAGWHFVSLPMEISKEIRANLKWQEEGWGRLKASAIIENTEWKTAIWFDTKHETYLLPLKASIRKKLNIKLEKDIRIAIYL